MINAYPTVDHAWRGVINDILAKGRHTPSRVGDCLEILGYTVTIENPSYRMLMNPRRKMSRKYVGAEFFWYFAGEKSIARLLPYAPTYGRFTNDGKETTGGYGWRMSGNSFGGANQFVDVYSILSEIKESRQCVISIWNPQDLAVARVGGCKDTPCALNLQFFIRDNKLHMVSYIRSNDVWLGMPYDFYCFMSIQSVLATALGIGMGTYTHTIGSVHIYSKYLTNCEEALSPPLPGNEAEIDERMSSSLFSSNTILNGSARIFEMHAALHTTADTYAGESSDNWIEDMFTACALALSGLSDCTFDRSVLNQPAIFGEIT